MTDQKPHTRTIAEILAGRMDGHLKDVADAITQRLRAGEGVQWRWRMRLDDDEWTEETVTVGELAFAERMLSTLTKPLSYMQIDPRTSIEHAAALMVAHLHKVQGMSPSEAVARAERIPLAEWTKVIDLYEVTDAPKGDPGTSTSS